MQTKHLAGFFLFLCLLTLPPAWAFTHSIPEWYRLSAALKESPQVGVPVKILATLTAVIGDLKDSKLTLSLPSTWKIDQPSQQLPLLREGSSHLFSWTITPPQASPVGSIICSVIVSASKEAVIRRVKTDFPLDGVSMAKQIVAWPDQQTRAVDIPFALLPEEGFYPLTENMWTSYDDRLKPANAKRGPTFYQDSLITPYQAQTDVEMFDRLTSVLKTNPEMASTLQQNGISLKKKERDFLIGLYVLATQSYLKGNFETTRTLIKRLEDLQKPDQNPSLSIAAGNLRALALLSQGLRKQAEDSFRNVFYQHRKHPLQRYVLRNLGLLMLGRSDVNSAREMFRLALQLKPTYTILKQEFEAIK